MKDNKNWWMTVVQGVIAALLGLYLLLGGAQAAGLFALVAAIYMLVTGIFDLLRGRDEPIRFYRSIASIISGVVLLFLYAVDILPTYWDFTIFAIGVIIVGAMGLYTSLFQRGGKEVSWGAVLINFLLLVWGALIFVARVQDFNLQAISGWILLAIGVVLALWGYFTRDKSSQEAAL